MNTIELHASGTRVGALIAMPIAWRELRKLSCATVYDLPATLDALTRRRRDPWKDIAKVRQSLT